MHRVIQLSRDQGARKLMLEVRKSNHGAIGFYTHFGFSIAGERQNYYSKPLEDAHCDGAGSTPVRNSRDTRRVGGTGRPKLPGQWAVSNDGTR